MDYCRYVRLAYWLGCAFDDARARAQAHAEHETGRAALAYKPLADYVNAFPVQFAASIATCEECSQEHARA